MSSPKKTKKNPTPSKKTKAVTTSKKSSKKSEPINNNHSLPTEVNHDKDILEHYNITINCLQYFFTVNALTNGLTSDAELSKIVTYCFSIINSVEKNFFNESTNLYNDLLVELKKYLPDVEIKNNINLKNKYDIIDELNWLLTYVKNRYNIDLTAPQTNQIRKSIDNISYEQAKIIDDTNNGVINENQASFYIQTLKLRNIAQARMNKDMQSGKLYIYQTKPKIIPILKLVIFSLLCLQIIAVAAFAIFLLIFATANNNDIMGAALYSIVYLFFIWSIIKISVQIIKCFLPKYKINQSEYYSFPFFTIILLYNIILVVMDIVINYAYQTEQNQFIDYLIKSGNPLNILISITWFALIGISIVLVIVSYITQRLRPKFDPAFPEILKQYVSESAQIVEASGNDSSPAKKLD